MPIGEPYKCYLESRRQRFERKGGAEFARKSISGLLQGLLIDSLLGLDLDKWLEIYELHCDAPLPEHSMLIAPQVYLLRAGAGLLLNQSVEAMVNAGWNAVDTAWSDANDDTQYRMVSSAALGLALSRKNQEEISHWCSTRQHYAPTDAMTDVELQLGFRAIVKPDIMALVGQRNVALLGESVANAIAALSAQAVTIGQPLASLLNESCCRIDEDYWSTDIDQPPRADFEDLTWSLSEASLNAYLFISGRGGYLHNPAPLLQPLLEIAQSLEKMLTGEIPESLQDEISNATLRDALADPDVSLQITLGIYDSIHNDLELTEADLSPFNQRLVTSVEWMQQRHPHFAGRVELICI